jgi:hypothetical protein
MIRKYVKRYKIQTVKPHGIRIYNETPSLPRQSDLREWSLLNQFILFRDVISSRHDPWVGIGYILDTSVRGINNHMYAKIKILKVFPNTPYISDLSSDGKIQSGQVTDLFLGCTGNREYSIKILDEKEAVLEAL